MLLLTVQHGVVYLTTGRYFLFRQSDKPYKDDLISPRSVSFRASERKTKAGLVGDYESDW